MNNNIYEEMECLTSKFTYKCWDIRAVFFLNCSFPHILKTLMFLNVQRSEKAVTSDF